MNEIELTWYLSGNISYGEIPILPYSIYIAYHGGSLAIFADSYSCPGYTDAEFGTEPPNLSSPGSFADGECYLLGEFYSFYILHVLDLHVGDVMGHLNWTSGTQLDMSAPDPHCHMQGMIEDVSAAPIPGGYDLRVSGQLLFDPHCPAVELSWGRVKSLYH
jgi:hypothetical protein